MLNLLIINMLYIFKRYFFLKDCPRNIKIKIFILVKIKIYTKKIYFKNIFINFDSHFVFRLCDMNYIFYFTFLFLKNDFGINIFHVNNIFK